METENVLLVTVDDIEIGLMEKMEAHEKAILHRAFSVFIFNDKNEFLLQQRALTKYHSPGLWTNTCCSHPRSGETTLLAAKRRLTEEMGMECELNEIFSFIYKADVGQGLTEHEFDHVFVGISNGEPKINPGEVNSWKFMNLTDLKLDMSLNPNSYTIWFRIAFEQVEAYILANNTIDLS
jgi:isopentenyl-diphosphate delta-isomerase